MLLGDGIATIWRGRNSASAGSMPSIVYDVKLAASYYGDKTVGVTRYWTAKAHDDRADLLIEIQRCAKVSTADRCQVEPCGDTGAAGMYKIIQVQHVVDADGLPMTDLTLERLEALDGTE